MLQVKTKLGESKIHGIGVFAAEDITWGTKVWEFDNIIDRQWERKEILRFPSKVQQFLYPYLWKEKYAQVYGMYGDDARFINHAVKPNLKCTQVLMLSDFYVASAVRDIKVGEELTWDYLQFDEIDITPGNLFVTIRQNCGIEPDEYDDWIEGRKAELGV